MNISSLLDPFDDADLECDGFTRVAHTILSKNHVPHIPMVGRVEWNNRHFSPHFWIELPDGRVVDYRLRMWFGGQAPHGVFDPEKAGVIYEGRKANIPILTDFLFSVLTGRSGGKMEAQELLRIARSLTGGIIQPPPVMVDAIYLWANAQIAAYQAENARYNIEEAKKYMEQAEQKAKEYREEGNAEEAEEREFRAKQFREEIARWEKSFAERLEIVRLFPRVQVRKWNRVSRKFKMDLRDWRYLPTVREAPSERKTYAENYYGVITVELVKGDLKIDANAYWDASSATMRVKTGWDLKRAIEHELSHWAQSYMNIILGKAETFGRPSRDIQTPDVSQWAKGDLRQKLLQRGIQPDELHSLDDAEFYTDLMNEVDNFRDKLQGMKIVETFGSKREFLRVFVGLKSPPVGWERTFTSPYFLTLKKHAPGKWQKAVKELSKAVL